MAAQSTFHPQPASMARQGVDWSWRVTLDPTEPYLAHHRAGDSVVLGVVASLEVMGVGASLVADGWPLVAIEDLELTAPVFVPVGQARSVTVRATPMPGSGQELRLRCAMTTTGDGGETVHMLCTMIFRRDWPPAEQPIAPIRAQARAASTEDIYKVFFHGPAFQVVAGAWRAGDRMVAQLARPLPDWTRTGGPSVAAPRLIEFGMQTSGLLHLASDAAMMIPRRIDSIVRHAATDVDHDGALYAVVERREAGAESPMDMTIVDAGGRAHMRIAGYRCTALTSGLDRDAISELARRF